MSCLRLFLLLLSAAIALPAGAVEITLSCGTIGSQYNICQQSVDRWMKQTGHTVRLVQVPKKTNDQLDFFRLRLAQPDPDAPLDVVKVDAIWINFVEQYLADLTPYENGAASEHFARLIENATFGGALKALPLWSGVGLFYYRKDLLEKHGEPVPRTYDEMEEIAARVQAAERRNLSDFWGYVFEATPGEGLTCNALEWLVAMGGAPILDDAATVSVNDPASLQTLRRVKGWIGTIAPPDVLDMNNEKARVFFQNGEALFMRNWPYAWAISQKTDSPLKGKVGVTSMLAGPNGAGGTHGGWYLGVSRHSAHPEIAADLVLFMTSKDEQLQRALFMSQNPTRPALYSDPDVRNVSDFFQVVFGGLQEAVNRPNAKLSGSYIYVSNVWSQAVHDYLAGSADSPASIFDRLQDQMERLERRGW